MLARFVSLTSGEDSGAKLEQTLNERNVERVNSLSIQSFCDLWNFIRTDIRLTTDDTTISMRKVRVDDETGREGRNRIYGVSNGV